MSVRAMAKVWERSRHSGSDLLVLLAIADFADDNGNAYPSVKTLAAKCRMKPRNARYCLAELTASDELRIQANTGPHGTNRYRLVFENMGRHAVAPLQSGAGLQCGAPVQEIARVQELAGVQEIAGMQDVAANPAPDGRTPMQQLAAEPSLNHQEPPTRSVARTRTQDAPELNALFERFWSQYPLKACRARAEKAFKKLKVTEPLLVQMLAGLAMWKAHPLWAKNNGGFIKYPDKWLTDRSWEDEEVCRTAGRTGGDWWSGAGFNNRYEANNAGCFEHNASQFRQGKRLEAA